MILGVNKMLNNTIASHNHLLGKFRISGIPVRKAGEERIRVEFSYNLNGMLEVEAKIVSTGKQASIEIDMMEGEKSERIDVSMWKDAPGAKAFRTVIRRAERRLRELEENEPLLFEELEDSLYHLKEALIKGDMEQAKEEEEFIMELLEE